MKRLRDCVTFAVWFFGTSYIVGWPLIAYGYGSPMRSVLPFCDIHSAPVWSCGLSGSWMLPLLLHGGGIAAAIVVLVQVTLVAKRLNSKTATDRRKRLRFLSWRMRKRRRRAARNPPAGEFGLRGTPR